MSKNNESINLFVYGGEGKICESTSWLPWKLSREDCILKQIKKKNIHCVADIGVDDMFYTKNIGNYVDGKIYAVDVIFPENSIIKDGIVCFNSAEKLPDNELDCLIMMDVLEHIEDDIEFFNTILNKLKDNGIIIITVPAFQFLYTAHDKRYGHYRRYNRKQLLALLRQGKNEIRIKKCHYFYTSMFLIRLLFMFRKDKFYGHDAKGWKYSEKNILTITMRLILNIDFWVNKVLDIVGIHLPGLSLLAVCKKEKQL